MVLAIGYRVRGNRGTQFRKWATIQLKEYLQKGFNLNDKALKNAGGGQYWKELLARIKDIRSSEKMLYRQAMQSGCLLQLLTNVVGFLLTQQTHTASIRKHLPQ